MATNTTKIFRVAVVNIDSYHVNYYFPTFFSSREQAVAAINKQCELDTQYRRAEIKDWDRHPWQSCESDGEGSQCVEMIKQAYEYNQLTKTYGIIQYSLYI